VLVLLLLAAGLQANPQDEKTKAQLKAKEAAADPLDFDRSIRGLLERFCYRCHNGEKRKGDLDLAKDENPGLIAQNRKVWLNVRDMLEKGEMPPKKEQQPTPELRKRIIEFIKKTLDSLDCSDPKDPGRPSLRRLSRAEYDNSILELTGLDLNLADGFSPDASSYGFDTIAEALALSPVLVEQYHEAARKALAAVGGSPEARRRVFFVPPGNDPRGAARKVVERFALKAFRRPPEPAFVEKLLGLYDKASAKGEAHEAAVGPALLAILISPRFLVRIEQTRPGVEGAYPVDEYDLASRLSYFLWSGPPDDVLLELASKGALSRELEAQARRMLADPRSRALAENFVGQWLQLRGLATHKPDPKRFPEFTESLREAMRREVELVAGGIVREDRPLTELVDAGYTYVNEELARHYGIEGVKGPEMRRVALSDRRRGGLLTSGAVLMLQSDPERTNIPRRGNYIAGTILGTPPPPPPPDVPQLEDSKVPGKELTLRQLLELHRTKPECASCHARIDPLGFGFQNFDAIGRWRDREGGAPVDASGVLPDGKTFNGPVELKQILLARRDDFARTLTENLLIYALGRGLGREDECVVRDALKAAAAGEYRFSTVVLAVVRSHPFRHRKNPDF
jgi:hypothetical protein